VNAPPNTVVVLDGTPYQLRWDKAAMFRADEIGLFGKHLPGVGLARAAKYVWAMLPETGRTKYAQPVHVAEALPPLAEVWPTINNAIKVAGPGAEPKNVVGSTSGPSPASSSA